MHAWANDAVFYHIYPLGMLGAPRTNDFASAPVPRLAELHDWIPHLRALGVTAVYLGPVFESGEHGYDTADYYRVDRRLGDNATLAEACRALREAGIRVVLDGVFHHVGRDFWGFRDLREHGAASRCRDWFAGVDFAERSPYGDLFGYHAWRGHHNLVKLNLSNPEVRGHIFGAVEAWVREFGIDGVRLDVAEDMDPVFLRDLAAFCRTLRRDFWLLGEAIHGDYRRLAGPGMLDSATNYELYKGLYSSHNDRNYFEVAHSLQRQFGEGGMYAGLALYTFADNHDVGRVASTLRDPGHLYPLHALLFTVPGVPSVYYGSEWGVGGRKQGGDDAPLRPRLRPDSGGPHPALAGYIARLAEIRRGSRALRHGGYRPLHVASEQIAFARMLQDETVVVAANAAGEPASLEVQVGAPEGASFADLLDPGASFAARGGRLRLDVPARGARILAIR